MLTQILYIDLKRQQFNSPGKKDQIEDQFKTFV